MSDNEVLPAMTNDCDEIPKLLKWIEESDARLVVHMEWAVPVSEAVQESRCGLQWHSYIRVTATLHPILSSTGAEVVAAVFYW